MINSENYAAVSEFPPESRWQTWRAMQRNGTILDLSRALVVVQAGESGGTWEAGIECLRRQRPLLVVQWEERPETTGNARLIEKGGIAVSSEGALVELLKKIRDEEELVRGGQQYLF
jgi:DNA processing protein